MVGETGEVIVGSPKIGETCKMVDAVMGALDSLKDGDMADRAMGEVGSPLAADEKGERSRAAMGVVDSTKSVEVDGMTEKALGTVDTPRAV